MLTVCCCFCPFLQQIPKRGWLMAWWVTEDKLPEIQTALRKSKREMEWEGWREVKRWRRESWNRGISDFFKLWYSDLFFCFLNLSVCPWIPGIMKQPGSKIRKSALILFFSFFIKYFLSFLSFFFFNLSSVQLSVSVTSVLLSSCVLSSRSGVCTLWSHTLCTFFCCSCSLITWF